MKQKLVLERSALGLGDIKYLLRYRKDYIRPDDPHLDGSHIHDCYEIYINLSGEVSFFVNNRLFPIKRGDVVFTRSGDIHFCVFDQATVHEYFCLWIGAEEGSPTAEFIEKNFKENFFSCEKSCDDISELLFKVYEGANNEVSFEETVNLLQCLLLLSEKREVDRVAPPSILPMEIQRIVDDINENFADIRSVADIIERHYISQATLNRRFKKYMKVTPRAFLESKKLAYAKLLLSAGASVTDACFRAGFSDCSHFISVFKRKFGYTPYKYKSK